MLAIIAAIAVQNPPSYYLVSETAGAPLPNAPGRYVAICEARVIGREAVVLLDTVKRGLKMKIEQTASPQSILDFAVAGLGEGGSRAVSEPESGYFAWVTVKSIRRIDP